MSLKIQYGRFKNMSPDDIRKWLEGNNSCQDLVDTFAVVCNQAFSVADNEYDYPQGSNSYQRAVEITDSWFILFDDLLNLVISFAREEGYSIPDSGYHYSLIPFIEKYGYTDGSGWWIKK